MITIPGKIPIRIYPFFWLLIGLIGWMNSGSLLGTGIWAVVIFVSVLIHEYGHALTAIAFGQHARIELVGLGGVTQRRGPKLKLWQEFVIVLNGPVAGFLLFLLAYWFSLGRDENAISTVWTYAIFITMYANLFWTIVNLLPVHPLDGGRLVSIVLESLFGMRGVQASLIFSSILSVLIAVGFFAMQALLAGSIFLLLAFESYRAWQSSLIMSVKDQDDDLQKQLKNAEDQMRFGNDEEALKILENIRAETHSGVIYTAANEHLAQILSQQGKDHEAFQILEPLENQLSPTGLKLLHQLAFRNKAFKEAIAVGDRSYQAFPNYETALTNAFVYAILGQEKPAIGWLHRAIGDGLPDPKAIFKRIEFDNIRKTSSFQALEHQYLN